MHQFRRLMVAGALLALPLSAADRAPVKPAQAQPTAVTAAGIIQRGSLGKVLLSYYTAAEIDKGVYIGSNFCLACHKDKAAFADTQHATFVRRPMTQWTLVEKKGVMGDVDRNGKDDFIDGLDFNTISSVFDAYKPNAPKLSVLNGTYLISVGGIDFPVVATLGGGPGQDQRFLVRVPVADTPGRLANAIYFGPISWSADTKTWAANGPAGWWDATTKLPKVVSATTTTQLVTFGMSNWSQGCANCHLTGTKSLQKVGPEWTVTGFAASLYAADDPAFVDLKGDGNMTLTGITCENCHGPGSNHVLGGPDPSKIINPAKLTAAQQQEICANCHISSASVPNGTFAFPFKDDTLTPWYPGNAAALKTFYKDNVAYWPDGKIQKSGRPFNSYQFSLHATNPYENVSCNVCHDIHKRTSNERQLIESMFDAGTKTAIKTSPEDNTLCLSCHATFGPFAKVTKAMVADYATNEEAIAKEISSHSHHPYGPDRTMGLSRCTTCHMSTTGGHSWRAVGPEMTLKYQAQGGMPNACGSGCHNNLVNVFGLGLKGTATTWDNKFDKDLATILQKYYGNGGTWWDTKGAASSHAAPQK